MQRGKGCIVHADGHDHADTHVVVRIDDLVTLIDELDGGMSFETELRIAQTGLDAVAAHLRTTASTGQDPSRAVLEALMKVYAKED